MIVVGIITGFFTLFYITFPFIITVHELGHAFAYLILTRPAYVNIYIGSHSDQKGGSNLRIGKINFFISHKLMLFRWKGQCVSAKPETNYCSILWIAIYIFISRHYWFHCF
jgi:hypothetical protein